MPRNRQQKINILRSISLYPSLAIWHKHNQLVIYHLYFYCFKRYSFYIAEVRDTMMFKFFASVVLELYSDFTFILKKNKKFIILILAYKIYTILASSTYQLPRETDQFESAASDHKITLSRQSNLKIIPRFKLHRHTSGINIII